MRKATCDLSPPTGLTTELGAFLRLCEQINTPRSLCCWMLITHRETDQYLSLDFPDPESATFRDDYAVTSMLSKNPNLGGSHDRRRTAIQRWVDAEDSCRVQNEQWQLWTEGKPSRLDAVDVRRIQFWVRRLIGGGPSRDDLATVADNARFGPGATSSVSGRRVLPSRKMTARWDVTPSLLPFFSAFVPFTEHWRALTGRVTDENSVTFVPKNSKTDRAIAIEPHGNIYVQLGIAAALRKRLRRNGYDLRTQKFVNRAYVRRAQRDKLATIDLSSASDTVAYRTVLELLPIEWVHLLDIARTPKSLIDKGSGLESITLQKFSSMGNGYTFELETLIFLAVCFACGATDPQVFGDDIIVDQCVAADVIATLEALGFRVNEAKTFLAGRFFESCGVDVHDGVNVRPPFFKGAYRDEADASIRIANAIRLFAARRNRYNGYDLRFRSAWLYCVRRSPGIRKTAAPLGGDNDALWCEPDEAHHVRSYPSRGWDGWWGVSRHYPPQKSGLTSLDGAYITSLRYGSAEGTRLLEYTRRAHGRPRLVRVLYGTWTTLGGWM